MELYSDQQPDIVRYVSHHLPPPASILKTQPSQPSSTQPPSTETFLSNIKKSLTFRNRLKTQRPAHPASYREHQTLHTENPQNVQPSFEVLNITARDLQPPNTHRLKKYIELRMKKPDLFQYQDLAVQGYFTKLYQCRQRERVQVQDQAGRNNGFKLRKVKKKTENKEKRRKQEEGKRDGKVAAVGLELPASQVVRREDRIYSHRTPCKQVRKLKQKSSLHQLPTLHLNLRSKRTIDYSCIPLLSSHPPFSLQKDQKTSARCDRHQRISKALQQKTKQTLQFTKQKQRNYLSATINTNIPHIFLQPFL